MGKSLSDFKLHHLLDECKELLDCTRDVKDALAAPIPPDLIDARKKLNHAQKTAYKQIIHCVKHHKQGAFFIDGPGGTGKTFLYCALYARVRQLKQIVLPTATSGIAAANMPTGRTAHSRFKIPVDYDSSFTCSVGKQSSLALLLKEAALIIWDEVSMTAKENVEALDLLLKDLCNSEELFGGKVIVFGGDFRQVLPVVPHKTQAETVEASLVSSPIWQKLKVLKLTENMRAKEDPQFCQFLLQLGNGMLQTESIAAVELPSWLVSCVKTTDETLTNLIAEMLPEINSSYINSDVFAARAILTPRNEEADFVNKVIISKFPGMPITYKSFDSVVDSQAFNYPDEFLHSLCPGGLSPHELTLKNDCPVILLRNLDPSNGLCNGTRLICKEFFPNMIVCEIAVGLHKGNQVFLPRICLRPTTSAKFPFQFERRQFPIKLCFAMTINKAQGQTLEQVAVYLKGPCFSHGQLYVALSRAQKSNQLRIFFDEDSNESETRKQIHNIVAFEVLMRAGIIATHRRTSDCI